MREIVTPPSCVQIYAVCINDKKPDFYVNEWIEEDRWYIVKSFTNALNISDGVAITILNKDGYEIHPNNTYWAFNSNRFQFCYTFLN